MAAVDRLLPNPGGQDLLDPVGEIADVEPVPERRQRPSSTPTLRGDRWETGLRPGHYREAVIDQPAPATAPTFRSSGVGVLDRVMAILDATEREPLTSSDIARELNLSQPTVYRLTSAMISYGLLRRDSQGRNHPGPRLSSAALAIIAAPVLEDMQRDTGETAQVWVLRGQHRYCVASIDSAEELRASMPTGTLLPLAAGGSAAVALTALPPDPANPERRWVESLGQRKAGLCSVSVAVTVDQGVVAALCLSAPLSRIGPEGPGARYGELVAAAADRLARLLIGQSA